MAKLATLSVLLAGFLLVSLAAATTITTAQVNEAEENRPQGIGRESCREQLEMADDLLNFEDFQKEQVRQGGFRDRCFEGMNPSERYGRWGRSGGESRRLRDCCNQLMQMDDECRCQGLREIVREQQQSGFGEERKDLERIAENIPQMCGVSPERRDIRHGDFGQRA